MLIIVPTRGRPDNLVTQFREAMVTSGDPFTKFIYCVDEDDEVLTGYERVARDMQDEHPGRLMLRVAPRGTITQIMNDVGVAAVSREALIGFMGDDHIPKSVGWDAIFKQVLSGMRVGMIYGNDLMQGRNLPTHIVMTSNIIHVLRYMVPPTFTHLYIDNVWKELGLATQRLIYREDIIIEHMHPGAGKALWDDGYKRVNAGDMYSRDESAFNEYMLCSLRDDVQKIIELIERAGA